MTVPLRFDQLAPADQARVTGNLSKMQAAGAPVEDVDRYLQDVEHIAPTPHLGNAAGMLSGLAQGATFGFADEALGGIDAASKALPKALGGESAPLSQFGANYRAKRDEIRNADKQYASEHPILHTGAALAGGLATALGSGGASALKAAPSLGGKLLSALDQGIVGGAASGLGSAEGSPEEQANNTARGGMMGSVLGPTMALAGAGAGAFGKSALNRLNLRPSEPITVGGMRLPINTVDEEAANKVAGAVAKGGKTLPSVPAPPQAAPKPSLLAQLLSDPSEGVGQPKVFDREKAIQSLMAASGNPGPPPEPPQLLPPGKPQTLMELGGQPVARLARTARSASPAAGQKIDETLAQRTAGAPDRAIDDALETSGLKMRTSAFQTTQALMEKRAADAEKAYGEAFKNPQPVTDPRIQQVLNTDVGKKAWARAQRTMSNLGMNTAAPSSAGMPTQPPGMGFSPEQWAQVLQKSGVNEAPMENAPNLQQLHYLKLAMDDLMEPGLNRGAGEGGIGRTEGRSILGVQKKLLGAMDDASPAYAKARQQFADQSSLVKANDLGQQLFSMSPEEAADAYGKMGSESEQKVFRRAGMDALANRLENGPANPEQSIAKPREQRRIRLLFPDDASFQQFKDRIAQEAEMVGTHRFVSGGSQTADKLNDLSEMLGLGTVAKAATGNLTGAAKDLAGGLMKMRGQSYGSRLGESIADMTTAGGNGDRNELARALQRLQATRPKPVRTPVAPLAIGDVAGLKQ